MKKIILLFSLAFLFSINTSYSQVEALSKGSMLGETNTGFGSIAQGQSGMGNTGLHFYFADGAITFGFGADLGYFVMDRLALKLGMGYSGGNDQSGALGLFHYKLGAKYYIIDKIPTEISLTGSLNDNISNPTFVGVQAGYALFLADNKVSLEPGLRVNFSLNDTYTSFIQFNIGFAVHL